MILILKRALGAQMVILGIGAICFLYYVDTHPDQEMKAGVVAFLVTGTMMLVVMVIMTRKFQKEYYSRMHRVN